MKYEGDQRFGSVTKWFICYSTIYINFEFAKRSSSNN